MSRMVFKNYGASYQLRIDNVEDLEKVQSLKEGLWAATSLPVSGLNCDPVFASYLDSDKNGRIRTDELKEALKWLFQSLANQERLSRSSDILRLDDINTTNIEGQKLRQTAELILSNLNCPESKEITLEQVRDVQNIMAKAANNGDGIIPPEAVGDADLSQLIITIMDSIGSVPDSSGKRGISQEQLEEFFQEAEAYLNWKAKGKIPAGKKQTDIMPFGPDTPEMYQLITNLDQKVEEYFTQCEMVRFDSRAASQMQLSVKELEELDFSNREVMESRLKTAPLAFPDQNAILDFNAKVNPFYQDMLVDLKEKVLTPIFEKPVTQLTKEQWEEVKNSFTHYQKWLEEKQGARVEKLGPEKLSLFLKGQYKNKLSQIIAKDRAVAEKLREIHNLEKLILYQRWIMELANNFVNFSKLYHPNFRSLFEMGTLVIDARELTFTMKVQNREEHKNIAEKSHLYLLYLKVVNREDKKDKFEIVAAVTAGDAGRLRIGKRGVFFTVDGKEWDAQVVDIVTNPISLWESIKAPFQQLGTFIGKQVEKFSTSRQSEMEKQTARGMSTLEKFTQPHTGSGATTTSAGVRDLLLGGGIAIAALGSAFAYITKALSEVRLIHILIALLGIGAIIVLPSMIMGFVKLRQRDMSAILEASGWAVNVYMKVTASLGKLFTHTVQVPKGSRKERRDLVVQFAQEFKYRSSRLRKIPIVHFIIAILILGFVFFVTVLE